MTVFILCAFFFSHSEGENVVTDDEPDAMSLYYADVNKDHDREPVFSAEIGLAVEAMPTGVTMQGLWQVN